MSLQIPLTQGKFATVDEADLPLVIPYRWFAVRSKHSWYARTNVRQPKGTFRVLPMHRLITDAPDGMIPHHRDGDGLNNTRANLELMTKGDNNRHRVRKRDTPATTVAYEPEDWRTMQDRYGNRIPLGSYKYPGMFALVDAEDYERVAQHRWSAVKDGERFYAVRRERNEAGKMVHVSMHRFVMNAQPDEMIDHIHGDGLDNRKSQLRPCDGTKNPKNQRRRSTNSSGFKGVSYRKDMCRWMATICVDSEQIYLGDFATAEAAARAYDEAARRYHGDFASPNRPPGGFDAMIPDKHERRLVANNSTGFRGVSENKKCIQPFRAQFPKRYPFFGRHCHLLDPFLPQFVSGIVGDFAVPSSAQNGREMDADAANRAHSRGIAMHRPSSHPLLIIPHTYAGKRRFAMPRVAPR